MGVLAEILLYCISNLGLLLQIPDTLMGITISACGASIPTLWTSMVVSKQGLADMAMSNALGANVFSVLVGLGLPWFMYPLYIQQDYMVEDDGIIPLVMVLLTTIFVYWAVVRYYNYYMHYWYATCYVYIRLCNSV